MKNIILFLDINNLDIIIVNIVCIYVYQSFVLGSMSMSL